MKTVPKHPRHPNERDTARLLGSLIVAVIMLAILLAATGCTVTVRPDYEALIHILGGDEIPRAIIPSK